VSASNELIETDYTNNVIEVTQAFEWYSALKFGQIWIVYFVVKFKVTNLSRWIYENVKAIFRVAHKCRRRTNTDVHSIVSIT
jgi:hypothetical protein